MSADTKDAVRVGCFEAVPFGSDFALRGFGNTVVILRSGTDPAATAAWAKFIASALNAHDTLLAAALDAGCALTDAGTHPATLRKLDAAIKLATEGR